MLEEHARDWLYLFLRKTNADLAGSQASPLSCQVLRVKEAHRSTRQLILTSHYLHLVKAPRKNTFPVVMSSFQSQEGKLIIIKKRANGGFRIPECSENWLVRLFWLPCSLFSHVVPSVLGRFGWFSLGQSFTTANSVSARWLELTATLPTTCRHKSGVQQLAFLTKRKRSNPYLLAIPYLFGNRTPAMENGGLSLLGILFVMARL